MTRARLSSILWPALWWAAIAVLYALHFVHLRADFPNFSPWMDYAKYTDEGWYANGAVRQALFGNWRLPGDFNPAVALPVWPLLLRVGFAVGGVSVVTARAIGLGIFALNLLLSYALLRRAAASRPVALAGVTFLAASAYLWAFSRLAILEPLMLLFLMLSWLLVQISGPAAEPSDAKPSSIQVQPHPTAAPLATHPTQSAPNSAQLAHAQPVPRSERTRHLYHLAAGLALALAVLTKTTAVFLIPATFSLLWAAYDFRLRRPTLHRTLKDAAWLATGGLAPWAAYYLLVVHPHFASDYHYLFAANRWDQPTTPSGWLWAFWYAAHGTLWVDPTLCGVALAVALLSILPSILPRALADVSAARPPLWREPLVVASTLASLGYIFFTGWHNNPQPRYYEVVAYPLVFVSCLGATALLHSRLRPVRALGILAWAAFAVAIALNLRGTLHFVRHPQYSLVRMARGVTRYIDHHPNGRRLLLSISGDQITLITHLPAICDDFGTTDLPYRIHQYQPGWYAAWNEIDPGTLEDLHTQYSLEQVARFPALDDEDRDVLILYKLHPLPPARRNYNAQEEEVANRKAE